MYICSVQLCYVALRFGSTYIPKFLSSTTGCAYHQAYVTDNTHIHYRINIHIHYEVVGIVPVLHLSVICCTLQMNSSMSDVPRRNILQILQSSLNDHQTNASEENQVRYKLIIDEMVDGSIIQLLSLIHVLKHANTRMLVLNKFSEDVRLQEVILYTCRLLLSM